MKHPNLESKLRKEWFERMGKTPVSKKIIEEIINSYNEEHRHYHDLRHVNMCIEEIKKLGLEKEIGKKNFLKLYVTLLVHDLVYNPKSNVLSSASYGKNISSGLGFGKAFAKDVYYGVIVTDHSTPPKNRLEMIAADADLAILGKEKTAVDQYDDGIRVEYSLIPIEIYRKRRKGILSLFLNRKNIYYTLEFRQLYESKARENLRRIIEERLS